MTDDATEVDAAFGDATEPKLWGRALEKADIELERELTRARLRAATLAGDKLQLETEIHARNIAIADASADVNRIYAFTDQVYPESVVNCQGRLAEWSRRYPGQPMRVVLNSPGGSVFDGLALYDTIRELVDAGTVVDVHGQGQVFSMSAVILQAGSMRSMSPNSFLMVHEVSHGAQGKTSHMEDETKFLSKVQATLVEILASRSHRTQAEIASMWDRRDWWMGADEALAAGFIDTIRT